MAPLRDSLPGIGRPAVLAVTLIFLVVLGFAWASYANSNTGRFCTQMACRCQTLNQTGANTTWTNITGGVDCNTCGSNQYVFTLGVVSIVEQCSEQQVYVCSEGRKVGEYYRDDGCSHELRFLE